MINDLVLYDIVLMHLLHACMTYKWKKIKTYRDGIGRAEKKKKKKSAKCSFGSPWTPVILSPTGT